ncbi:Glycosyl hydrolase family 35 protein [Euphorbia peplus]|nr:Glycosyl hydrolase family 35 protein [Euphorbia peplus]
MKVSVLWIFYFLFGILCFSNSLSISDAVFIKRMDGMKMTLTSRNLHNYNPGMDRTSDSHNMNVEDYNPIDPVPSSKASIKPGPIEHGTPLNPYIPKHSPPLPPPLPTPPHPKKGAEIP